MAIVYFFYFGAVGALSPFLSLYYKQAGLTGTQISVLSALPPLLIFISQPIFGPLTDRSGHRGRMLGHLLLATAVTGLSMAMGSTFWTLLPFIAGWAFFSGLITPTADSIALGEVQRTGVTYPQLRLWGSIGFLIVTILIGRVFTQISLRWMFPIYTLLIMIAWFYAHRLPQDGVSAKRAIGPALKELLRNRLLLIFLLLSAMTWMAQAAHATFYSVHLTGIGGSSNTVGWAWGLAAAMEVPVWTVLGRLTKRIGPVPILAFATLVYGVRFWIYGMVTDPAVLVGLQVLQAFSFAMFMPTAVVLVGELTPPELRTSGQALLALTNGGLATIVGTLGAGRIVDRWGTAVLYKVSGSMAFLSAAGFLTLLVLMHMRHRWEGEANG
jgi:PPP family 3-phenylpropionic acid transporter